MNSSLSLVRLLLLAVVVLCSGVLMPSRVDAGEPNAPAQTVWLDWLDLSKVTCTGHGNESMRPGRNILGQPMKIAGREFKKGLGVRAHSLIYIDLKRSTLWLKALVGLDDAAAGKDAAVKFHVFGDGRELFNSGLMRPSTPPQPVDLDVSGVETLILSVIPFSRYYWDNLANWANARFEYSGAPPQTIAPPVEPAVILTPKPAKEPRINCARVFGVRPGSPCLFTVATTGERPMTFSAEGLPEGLTLDARTGIITGSVSQQGEYNVHLQAKNKFGKTQTVLRLVVGDQLALTPPMGWNHWYTYTTAVTDQIVRGAADAMVESSMINFGYAYVNIDDCWMPKPSPEYEIFRDGKLYQYKEALGQAAKHDKADETRNEPIPDILPRDEQGRINANRNFPDMKALTDHIHGKGLKAGIYISPGPLTCAGHFGSYMFVEQDAHRFAEWGFDFLKYDWCSYGRIAPTSGDDLKKPYRIMSAALRRQRREIVLNLCQYGMGSVWEWAPEVGGHCWRTTGDLGWPVNNYSLYSNIITIGFCHHHLADYAGPGHWNDPDYLLFGKRFGLTPNEHYTQMTLWCMLASPLMFSGDMTQLDDFTLNILCNAEVLQVNQDPLGRAGKRVFRNDDGEVWVKDMEDGSKAAAVFNISEFERDFVLRWSDLGIRGKHRIRDLWRQQDKGVFRDELKVSVPRHGAALIRLFPLD